ncbi:Stress-response A/B barrel domain-containing protein UP3 [Glycine max]|nr:Stress-response A/B barrel domain-containing protein UP3 [Glycine max]
MQEKIQGYCLHSQPHGRNEERLKGRSIYPWLRVTFFKLKEGVGEHVKDEVLGAIRGIQRKFQFTCGGNFSPARAKGFFIASLEELGNYLRNEKIKEHLESVMVLHYVIQV